jgi:hypothetical protein
MGTAELPAAGSRGLAEGDGLSVAASATALSGAGLVGGIDGSDTFWRPGGAAARSSAGRAISTSAGTFLLGAVTLRRRFGWAAPTWRSFRLPRSWCQGHHFFLGCLATLV